MKCAQCLTENDADARFCKNCGQPLGENGQSAGLQAAEKEDLADKAKTGAKTGAAPAKIKSHSWIPALFFPAIVLLILLISYLYVLVNGG